MDEGQLHLKYVFNYQAFIGSFDYFNRCCLKIILNIFIDEGFDYYLIDAVFEDYTKYFYR